MKSSELSNEQQAILAAMSEMYEAGILPSRINWGKRRPKGLPSYHIVSDAFDGEEWRNIVGRAVSVEICCRQSWNLATGQARRNAVIETIAEMAEAQNGRAPMMAEWNSDRPGFLPRASIVVTLFGKCWTEILDSMGFCDRADAGIEIKPIANGRKVEPQTLNLAPPMTKRIWLGQGQYRTVEARLVL